MSFGLEVFNAEGGPVFSAGRAYVQMVDEIVIPEGSSYSADYVISSFTLPPSIPTTEHPFISCSIEFAPVRYEVSGRRVTVYHPHRFVYHGTSRYYTRRQVKLYLGFYA